MVNEIVPCFFFCRFLLATCENELKDGIFIYMFATNTTQTFYEKYNQKKYNSNNEPYFFSQNSSFCSYICFSLKVLFFVLTKNNKFIAATMVFHLVFEKMQ